MIFFQVMNVNGAIFQNINNQAFLFVFSGMLVSV